MSAIYGDGGNLYYCGIPNLLPPPADDFSNHRLTAFDGERVTFHWKDYATLTNSA